MKNIFRISGVILLILSIFLIHSCKKKEEVPVIATTAVSNITTTTATSGGNITSEGSSTVISRGVCWSTGTTPAIADSKTTDGAGAGSFPSNIIDLFGGTTYYVRAYATNGSGTGYGMALSFKTSGQPPSAPSATAQNASSVQLNSAQLNGTVNANYYSTVVTFEYGTTTTYGSTATATQNPITGGINTNISATISDLTVGTTYHFRVKAVNSLGTTNSNDITFTTVGQVPTVTKLAATNITTVAAQLNGTVNANYLSTVVTFEYGTTTTYGSTITATQSPVTGNTNTNVSADITGLTEGTTYHFRVKAVNSLGTTNGSDMTLTTLGLAPTSLTQSASIWTTTSASLIGMVNANYLSTTVTFEYGTSTSYENTIAAIQNPVTGSTNTYVNAPITNLTIGTTYHFRVKAENSLGTTYGNDMTFTTLLTLITVTDMDGNTYNTVTIGTQVWMSENLKTTKYSDGALIPLVTDATSWSNPSTHGYCWYNNDLSNYKDTYGALYNFLVVCSTYNGGKNICPSGWHVPSYNEWVTLALYLDPNAIQFYNTISSVAGGKLKEGGTDHWQSPNFGATNETGFTALPGGYRSMDGTFSNMGKFGMWWSSLSLGIDPIRGRFVSTSSTDEQFSQSETNSYVGYSVRCLRDN